MNVRRNKMYLRQRVLLLFAVTIYLVSVAETMEGIDLGETTHKKPGTTVPESIHSFSKSAFYLDFIYSRSKPLLLWLLLCLFILKKINLFWILLILLSLTSWRWPCATWSLEQESHPDYQQGAGQTDRWVVLHTPSPVGGKWCFYERGTFTGPSLIAHVPTVSPQ